MDNGDYSMSLVPSSGSDPHGPRASAMSDKPLRSFNGYAMLAILIALFAAFAWYWTSGLDSPSRIAIGLLEILVLLIGCKGFMVLQPNMSAVCMLFGSYVGTEHRPGFWWVNPFNSKKKISRRLVTLECGPLKVNDAVGNPIDIGAVVVWRVEDAAKALLEVGSYENYVKAQSETALRRMASAHPYDLAEIEEAAKQGALPEQRSEAVRAGETARIVTLRDGSDAISDSLLGQIRDRMQPIGVGVDEARISHLAYSPEIAGSMLRKQAASAVVSARRLIVKGAVSIVEDALEELDRKKLDEGLDPERRAAMISNLLVVLVADREVTPVINTGTLYS
jgi:regulator of protease activity HflC (stomatin/prohibitin superfamily)